MSEKRKVIRFSELETQFGNRAQAVNAYRICCQIGGFGNLGQDYMGGHPSLSLAGLPDEQLAQIENVLKAPNPPESADSSQESGDENSEGENA